MKKLSDLATDGCSVMAGGSNGVSAQPRKESPLLPYVHCICHCLALACGDAINDVSYVTTVKKILIQSWSFFFDNSAKTTAAYGKAVMAMKAINLSATGRKKVAKSFKKACRTRWLLLEKAIDGVFDDFEALCQMLHVMQEKGNSLETGFLNPNANMQYMLHAILPALAHLSKAFQEGNVSFAAITPAIKYTVDTLQGVAATNKPLQDLKKKKLGDGGRLSNCNRPTLPDFHEKNLTTLAKKYVTVLKENADSRFKDSLSILTAFQVFDPTAVPGRSDPTFKEYGVNTSIMGTIAKQKWRNCCANGTNSLLYPSKTFKKQFKCVLKSYYAAQY